MPIDYQQARSQVKSLGKQAKQREEQISTQLKLAQSLLQQHQADLQALRQKVERASANENLRCAVPVEETLTFTAPTPTQQEEIVILAADGSQIAPDRHAAVEYGVVNTGAIRILPNQPIPPIETIETQLIYGEALRPDGIPMGEEIIALLRDLNERQRLAVLAAAESLPVVTLTDGPLELFMEREKQAVKPYRRYFDDYLKALENLSTLSAVTAGYVDRPGSGLVVRLLELLTFPDHQFEQKAGKEHPLEWVSDVMLYQHLLQPGERSAIFAIQSPSARHFKEHLALHFFYLNVGRVEDPSLARVEIPAWVAVRPTLLNRLHAALVAQCQASGARPFPYALHRAHEVAVVTHIDRDQLETMIIKELIQNGFKLPHTTHKQFLKNISGKRTRFK